MGNFIYKKEIITVMIPDFDENGNLPNGIINSSLLEFKDNFIITFKDSSTRPEIFKGYLRYCDKLLPLDIAIKQWINGSFTTNKVNPNDIDFVTHIDALKVDGNFEIQTKLSEIRNTDETRKEFLCDVYFIPLYPQQESELYQHTVNRINYWRKWFGHDRNMNPKGIIELKFINGSFAEGDLEGELSNGR